MAKSLVYDYSFRVDVFQLDGREYHYNGSTWSYVIGNTIEQIIDYDKENELNQLYKEWRQTGEETDYE
jgi:hypothetical protein